MARTKRMHDDSDDESEEESSLDSDETPSETETETDEQDDDDEDEDESSSRQPRQGFGKSKKAPFKVKKTFKFGKPPAQPAFGFGQPAPAFGGGFGQPAPAFGGGFGQPAPAFGGFGQPPAFGGGFNYGKKGFGGAHNSSHSRASWLGMIEDVERNVVGLDIAEKYLRDKIPSMLDLSEEVTVLEKDDEPDKRDLDAYKRKRICEVLVEEDRVYIDQEEYNALMGLKAEKEKEKELIENAKKQLVLQELSERVRFMDLEFEKEFAPFEAAETSRKIEIEYKNLQVAQYQRELESQRKLTLTIARAQMGDTGPDHVDLERERQKKLIEDQKEKEHLARIANLKNRLFELHKKMGEDLVDEQMKKFQRVPLAAKGISGPSDGPTDGDSEDESTIPRPDVEEEEPAEVAATAKPQGSRIKQKSKAAPKKKVTVVSEATKEVTTKLFGLSTEVSCDLWDALKEASWKKVLLGEAQQPYFTYLSNWLQTLRKKTVVYPPSDKVFEAFNLCPFDKVKVVIVGQDPYHDKGQANGLCFSVSKKTKIPPSLRNIFGELKKNYPSFVVPKHGDLSAWASRGVLLLNSVLTVEHKKPTSHSGAGWQNFTDVVIKILNERKEPIVFMLWGNYAKKKCNMINRHRHRVVENAHPSPLSFARWTGCKTFARCDDELTSLGYPPMDWSIPA